MSDNEVSAAHDPRLAWYCTRCGFGGVTMLDWRGSTYCSHCDRFVDNDDWTDDPILAAHARAWWLAQRRHLHDEEVER